LHELNTKAPFGKVQLISVMVEGDWASTLQHLSLLLVALPRVMARHVSLFPKFVAAVVEEGARVFGLYLTEPSPLFVFDRTFSNAGGVFRVRLWAAHGGVDLSTNKADERLDRLVVVDHAQMSQRTARRRHSNAWNLPPFDDRYGIVYEV